MKKVITLALFVMFFAVTISEAQEAVALKDSLFSEAIAANFRKYELESNKAYEIYDFDRGKFLFDSLVKHCLKSTYLDNFKVKTLNGATIALNEQFDKPILLITYASWCVKSEGETPAINALAKKYHDKIDFVVLYWDTKNDARKAAKKYNKHISVVYIDELENNFSSEIINLKHTFGFPTSFYIDSKNRIMDIKRVNPTEYRNDSYLEAYTQNYNFFIDGLSSLLINGEIVKEHLAGK